jgi:hypothetical protein
MYAGHYAAGLALKASQPRVPTWAVLLGVGFLDVLFGIFVMLGIERVTLTPGVSPGFSLDFIDWSHSLAMSLVWAVVFSRFFWRRGRAVALAAGLAVFSHFLLDWPMHPDDLALWPHSSIHIGLGLWRSLPVGWWWLELGCIAAGCAYYVMRARRLGTFGGHPYWACGVVVLLHVINSPWLAVGK